MKFSAAILALCALAGAPFAHAAKLTHSTLTEVVKDVTVIAPATKAQRPAQVRGTFGIPDVLRTGPDSRAEMVAEDLTVTRVGANTLFSFEPERREVNLERGSILFHSPKGKGGGTIKTAAATASVLGTTLIVVSTKNGGFKVLMLEGKGRIETPRGERRMLTAGQMTFLLPGQKLGPIYNFQLREQVGASKLVSGFKKPLPSLPKITAAIARQEAAIARGQLARTGSLLAGDSPDTAYQVNPSSREAALAEEQPAAREERRNREEQRPSRFRLALGSNAVVDALELDAARIFTFGDDENAPEFGTAPQGRRGDRAAQGNATLFIARHTAITAPLVDLSPFEGRDVFQFLSVENLRLDGPVTFQGLSSTPLSLVAGGTISATPGTVLTANTRRVELLAFGSSFEIGDAPEARPTADAIPLRLSGFTLRNNRGDIVVAGPSVALDNSDFLAAGDIDIVSGSALTLRDTRSAGASGQEAGLRLAGRSVGVFAEGAVGLQRTGFFTKTSAVSSGRALTAQAVAFSDGGPILLAEGDEPGRYGSVASLRAVSLIDIAGATFRMDTVSMQANTITLRNVTFREGSTVTLDSARGELAPNPNTGRPAQPGYVNFIRNVNFGKSPAQNSLNEGLFIK